MIKLMRAMLVVVFAGSLGFVAKADEGDGAMSRAKMEQGKRAIGKMREDYAYVLRKEEEAKAEHDPVRLNALHGIVLRIADLVNVSDHALDDMRVAITSNEPSEAVDAELEKITLAKTKVEEARREADRTVGVKMLGADNGEAGTSRDFSAGAEALTGEGGGEGGGGGGGGSIDSFLSGGGSGSAAPAIANHGPPASGSGMH